MDLNFTFTLNYVLDLFSFEILVHFLYTLRTKNIQKSILKRFHL